ncbi:hypothetical protein ACIPWF_16545 [Paenarthrobacter sp. NPDC089989]|uniref:hypothetical protein n=1 Tax=unclassified Paenarthrobacter TaxID=2634190 RepID=UPI003816D04E
MARNDDLPASTVPLRADEPDRAALNCYAFTAGTFNDATVQAVRSRETPAFPDGV